MLNDQFITGPMLWELALCYTKHINNGCLPRIQNAWDSVWTEEISRGLRITFESINEQINKIHEDLPLDEEFLFSYKNQIFETSLQVFHDSCSIINKTDDKREYFNKIATKIDEEYAFLVKHNKEALNETLQKYFNNNFKPTVSNNLKNRVYTWFEDYEKEAEIFKKMLLQEFQNKGSNVDLLIDQMFLRYNTMIFKEISSK